MIDKAVGRGFCGDYFSVQQGIECPLHIFRGEWPAIVKANSGMQVEDVSERVWDVPLFGQAGLNIEVFVTCEQIVKDQIINSFRLSINANSRIEIRGTALNDHYHFAAAGFSGTRNCAQNGKQDYTEDNNPYA